MSVSVLPYIFNSLALQTSEEEKRAWNERRKMNVKRVVEELISEDLKFARTVLSIRPHSRGQLVLKHQISRIQMKSIMTEDM